MERLARVVSPFMKRLARIVLPAESSDDEDVSMSRVADVNNVPNEVIDISSDAEPTDDDADIVTTDGTDEVTGDGPTAQFYEVDFANSTFELAQVGDEQREVGDTVIMTYTATDQEGEEIEFKAVEDEQRGKMKAVDVTGPEGDFVQGAPPPPRGSPRD